MGGNFQKNNHSKNIFPVLFDIKPVTAEGDLDISKLRQLKRVVDLRGHVEQRLTKEQILAELEEIEATHSLIEDQVDFVADQEDVSKDMSLEKIAELEDFYFPEIASFQPAKSALSQRADKSIRSKTDSRRQITGFLIAGILLALIVPGVAWLSRGFEIKDNILSSSMSAYQNLLSAQESLKQADWQNAEQNFGLAHSDFLEAYQEIKGMGQLCLGILERLPGKSLVSSGSHLLKVGENLSQAGQDLTSVVQLFSFGNLFDFIGSFDSAQNGVLLSKTERELTDNILLSQDSLSSALEKIEIANQELEKVKEETLPADIQEGVASLKEKLPLVEEMLRRALDYSEAFLEILGHSNPRTYLLIFQNNSEIRATGGFIGTYGLLTLDKGKIKNLFIDGVFNADGQLHEKIIPPRPIQKISTAWSMHDANWFADFPTSAQKIAWFYEKTGGPTVDGVIGLTPTVIERLLGLTGPIALLEYDVVLTSDNFVELIQYEVEVDYDKELNQPKKILADFAPKFIQALNQLSSQKKKEALEIFFNCLKEKHILTFFEDESLEVLAVDEGWSGRLLPTEKDYLSVVSSNINGYKTDRVIEEVIQHQSEIQADGSIIDTLTITRQHQGGGLEYDWWNRVNANYLRVYLPLGSQLLSAKGQTLEIYQPPIDYEKHGFKTDPLVDSIESRMVIDKKTGTRIFEENNKTVFGNWIYVSPGKKVVLTYKYKLPFKIDLTKLTDSYSLLVQKQSGSLGSQFSHQLTFPADWQVNWQYPADMNYESGIINHEYDLKVDRFLGATFEF